jgi:phosphatidylinositol alpha-mannosyltransferase
VRIALLHPTYWPEVRRGSERLAHDLAAALAGRGHEVSLLTTHAGARTEGREDGFRVVRGRRMPALPGMHWYDEHVDAIPATFAGLVRGGYDLAHALYPVDGWAARLASRLGGPPYVLSIHGVLNREYLVRRRYRLEMLSQAAAGAVAVSALSEAAAEPLRRYALADPVVVGGGVALADYAGPVERPPTPTLLCPAALDDPRKRGPQLLEAFALVREGAPGARLVLAGDPGGLTGAGLELAPAASTAELATAYRRSTATVLPAEDEAFGLVLVESLAAGTPVVAARSGACPEIVDDPRVGRLFEPGDAADLARAIGEAIELAADPATAATCRAHARRWDWDRVVESYEALYAAAPSG